ncbi:unnamed protein product [Gulo gulo]|uniref:Cytochrome c oxidase subunit 7B, mitochondrial n=1 Tax=Gulo gulo TaxID=48420 RepID=A0A9X9MBU2_GULGU|nr:unnamed protein product [Gulo gulo]
MARQSHQKRTPDFHDKCGNTVLASGATFCICCVGIYSNTNWNSMDPIPCWQSHPKGMEKSVIIPVGVILVSKPTLN